MSEIVPVPGDRLRAEPLTQREQGLARTRPAVISSGKQEFAVGRVAPVQTMNHLSVSNAGDGRITQR